MTVLPRSLRQAGPLVGTLVVVDLGTSAVAYGAANPCPEQVLVLGAGFELGGGSICAVFRDTPVRLARAWVACGERANPMLVRAYRAVAMGRRVLRRGARRAGGAGRRTVAHLPVTPIGR